MLISKVFNFDAAHQLPPENPVYGKCRSLHGHTYHLTVTIEGEVNEEGWLVDFKKLKEYVNEKVINKLDHSFLNEIIFLPTAENILIWIANELKDINAIGTNIKLKRIKLYETPTSFAELEL
jgi:6-pyruvoyltetrahydropterin/6-carboxytetrahydropterin synthase